MSVNEWLEACATSPLFAGIMPERIETLLRDGREERRLAHGEELCGYLGMLGIVISGRLRVRNAGGALLNELLPGMMFGVSTIFTDHHAHITTISAAVTSQVLLLDEKTLTRIFAEEFAVNRNYLAFLTDRIRFLNRKLDLFSAASAQEKLRIYLLHQRRDGALVQVEPLARLGTTLGMGRASLYRVIEKLEEQGCIVRETRGSWRVDWERLEHTID